MAEWNQIDYAAVSGGTWWSWKIPAGAILMSVAVVGAQFMTRDFTDVGVWAVWMVGSGVPTTAVAAVVLLTAPPRGQRRSIFAMIVALAALAELLAFYLSGHLPEALHYAGQATIFLLALVAGAGAHLHLARALRAAHRPFAAAAFFALAMLILINATLFLTRYGLQMGLWNAWTYTAPGVGERVTPFAFVQDFLTRPQVEMQKNIENPLRGAYMLVTIVTPLWCAALMIWLMARGGNSSHCRPPGP
jgi:hypothetical protein